MPSASIHHVQIAIPARGEAAARAFYGELLGLAEVAKPANLRRRGGIWFRTANIQLHLGIDPSFRPAETAHVAFRVADLASVRGRLATAGHPADEDEPLPGYQRCYGRDPFGNRIELLEPV